MNKEITFEDFKEFVSSQLEDKKINHKIKDLRGNFIGWCGCAVGEFVQTILNEPVGVYSETVQNICVDFTKKQLPEILMDILMCPTTAPEFFPNYGELSKALEQY